MQSEGLNHFATEACFCNTVTLTKLLVIRFGQFACQTFRGVSALGVLLLRLALRARVAHMLVVIEGNKNYFEVSTR